MDALEWHGLAHAAQASLDDLDQVIAGVNTAIRERVPEYALVSDEQLTAATTRNISLLLTALRDRRRLTSTDLKHFESTVEERARNGVAVDEYLLAVSTAEQSMWDQLWKHASEPISDDIRLRAFEIRFENFAAISRVTTTAHRRIELVTAREEYERRALALRAVLRGLLPQEDLREHTLRLGLNLERPYFVVRAAGRGGLNSDEVQRQLAGGRGHAPHAAFALWGEQTVGLVADRPAQAKGVTAGIAGPVPVAGLPKAHEQATLAFDTAWALGQEGVHDVASLGLKSAVQASAEMGRLLREKYLAPLHASGSLGEELLSTIRVYLETGSRRDAAAAQLHIHFNTVGYRLNRFSELTHADLSDLTTLAELWWLFADLDLRPGG